MVLVASKKWYTANELAGLPGLPGDKSSVNRRANKEGWERRQKKGTRGIAFEFHISSLPPETQAALGGQIEQATIVDITVLTKVIEAVEILLQSGHKTLSATTKARVIAILYRAAKSNDFIDIDLVRETIDLVA
ncbi:DNA-binding protein [Rahnella sp. ChDrAdgB13]|uniref:DNA-binding protein n=1 Tax=Rahnella sp. ChDrAdgB13 TaxID=1850581 RepID=UPI001AD87A7B|nr:DNA-binding protein [Rahnella sp. ChDrAdgB13]